MSKYQNQSSNLNSGEIFGLTILLFILIFLILSMFELLSSETSFYYIAGHFRTLNSCFIVHRKSWPFGNGNHSMPSEADEYGGK